VNAKRQVVTGAQLIQDYQSTLINTATAQAATYEANRSEDDLLGHLQSVSGNRYLDAGSLAPEKDQLTHASLDAHIKKVQAEQLNRMSSAQLDAMQAEADANYVGRNVRITVPDVSLTPIDAVLWDQRNGWRNIISKRRNLNGTVENVLLDKNALVIKPSIMTRFFNGNVQSYVVYIINPETFTPMVDVSFG
jgi:hypothetical protein